jgi:SpoVK/Ycf46/Vps4 family AAA+-type ATPase
MKQNGARQRRRPGRDSLSFFEPRGELANLLSVQTRTIRLADMAMPESLSARFQRVLVEQRQQKRLREHGLQPRRKLLFVGPSGSGKTMTASALASELHLPLFTIMLKGLITKFMGETAAKLRLVFDAIRQSRGVYLFDEFDALGAHRTQTNDVGEIRRVLNSFLQLLEKDASDSLIVAATNHPQMLDRALFRRFDDVIEYALPDACLAEEVLRRKLAMFETADVNWPYVLPEADGLSFADLARASEEAAKQAVLAGSKRIVSKPCSRQFENGRRPASKRRSFRATCPTSIYEGAAGPSLTPAKHRLRGTSCRNATDFPTPKRSVLLSRRRLQRPSCGGPSAIQAFSPVSPVSISTSRFPPDRKPRRNCSRTGRSGLSWSPSGRKGRSSLRSPRKQPADPSGGPFFQSHDCRERLLHARRAIGLPSCELLDRRACLRDAETRVKSTLQNRSKRDDSKACAHMLWRASNRRQQR